jgi:hypothetical protein
LEEILRVAPPVAGVTMLADLVYDARPLLPRPTGFMQPPLFALEEVSA